MENKNINRPCIMDIIIRKDEVDVCYTTEDGQEETKLYLGEGDSEMLTVNFGDVSSIGFGGTDNWGKDFLPLYLDYSKSSTNYDGVYVDTIEIQKTAGAGGWCACELINDGKLVKYTALTENSGNENRIAYFYHKTKDKTVNGGYNIGRPVLGEWCVTVIQKANPGGAQKEDTTPAVKPESSSTVTVKDLGGYKYKVGLISDLHICKANNSSSSNWWDEDDFRRAMSLYVADSEVKFIASCGDVSEASTNDAVKHPEATAETDYNEFKQMYDVPYWQVAGLRFFSPLGNHDFYGLFESRQGDNIVVGKNSETTFGYNASVSERIGKLWPTDGGINGIVPARGRIQFELENGKHTAQGQADMSFFAYNAYVDLYKEKSGYSGSVWDSNKGGISNESLKVTKAYVNNNWNACKDNLSGWNATGLHGRNGYSKLNYWMKKDNDIYVFLSVDYGNDVWGVTGGWHDRMIHARTIINVNEDDPYIKRMKEYVTGTGYSSADEAYNYQYYSPNTLIWLKEIIENNRNCKIYIFTHHFMPNRVGNGIGVAREGNWFYSVISPDGVKDDRESRRYNSGSNALTGIEYWFIDKLLNQYKNIVWFSGHSHISFSSGANFDNHDYPIISPSERNHYVYTKSSMTPTTESAWCVALPSLSKPRGVENGKSVRHYEDAEMGVMEVYEKGIVIKGYKVKENNKDTEKLLVEKIIKLL